MDSRESLAPMRTMHALTPSLYFFFFLIKDQVKSLSSRQEAPRMGSIEEEWGQNVGGKRKTRKKVDVDLFIEHTNL